MQQSQTIVVKPTYAVCLQIERTPDVASLQCHLGLMKTQVRGEGADEYNLCAFCVPGYVLARKQGDSETIYFQG